MKLEYLFPQQPPFGVKVAVNSLHLLTRPTQESCLSPGLVNCFFPWPLQA